MVLKKCVYVVVFVMYMLGLTVIKCEVELEQVELVYHIFSAIWKNHILFAELKMDLHNVTLLSLFFPLFCFYQNA